MWHRGECRTLIVEVARVRVRCMICAAENEAAPNRYYARVVENIGRASLKVTNWCCRRLRWMF